MTEDYLQGYADAMNYAIENRPKTDEVLKKDAALHQARHMLGKWDGGFSFDDFEADVTFLLLDIAEALGETHD